MSRLYSHQETVIDRFAGSARAKVSQRGLLVVHITGLGKTRTAVESANRLLEAKEVKKVWVVTPLSTHGQWRDEIAAHVGGANARHWEICTHQSLSSRSHRGNFSAGAGRAGRAGEFTDQFKDSLLIVDEAHKLRTIQTISSEAHTEEYGAIRSLRSSSGSSRRGKRQGRNTFFGFGKQASVVFEASKAASRVLLLTATPVFNSSMDLHNLGAMLHGHMLANTVEEWQAKVEDPAMFASIFGGQVSVQLKHPEEDKCQGFPRVEIEERRIDMDEVYYSDYMLVQEAKTSDYPAHIASMIGRSNPRPYLNGTRRAANNIRHQDSPKIKQVVSEITKMLSCSPSLEKGPPEKMAIFSSFRNSGVLYLAEQVLPAMIPGGFAVITGDTKPEDRFRAIERYNADKIRILLFTKAGAEGVDLKGTSLIILLEPQWNMATTEQAMARAIRMNSHTHLPVERRLVKVLKFLLNKPKSEHLQTEAGRTRLLGDAMNETTADGILDAISWRKKDLSEEILDNLVNVSIEKGW